MVNDSLDELELLTQYLRQGPNTEVRTTERPTGERKQAKPKVIRYPRLTKAQIEAIVEAPGSMRLIASQFEVSVGTVHAIKSRKPPYDDFNLLFRK